MVEESGCQIKLTNKDKQIPGLPERVLSNTGKLDQVLILSCQICCNLSDLLQRRHHEHLGVPASAAVRGEIRDHVKRSIPTLRLCMSDRLFATSGDQEKEKSECRVIKIT